MAVPRPDYGQTSYEQPSHDLSQEEYDHTQQPDYEDHSNATAPQAASVGGRKKRNYAGQAYEFGGGVNSALGGHQVGGVPNPGPYPLPPGASDGYPQIQQAGYYQQGYGGEQRPQQSGTQPAYGSPQPSVGGYQSPDPSYPTQMPTPIQPGIGGITQGMNNMSVGGQQQHQMHQRPQLNQLYPTDLLNQPFAVSELNLPPPPVILPPNVSCSYDSSHAAMLMTSIEVECNAI